MSRKHLVTLAAFAISALPAQALDLGNGFTLTGDVELEYFKFDGSSSSETFAVGDVNLGWRSQAAGGLGFGFDVNPVVLRNLDGDSYSEIYGGLVFVTGFGEVTIGNPRPLLDTLSPAPDVGDARVLGIELGVYTRSFLATTLLLGDSINSYGVSLTGQSGAFAYGAAINRLESGSQSVDFLSLTGSYETGGTLLYAGVEDTNSSALDLQTLMLGARYDQDNWAAGAEVVKLTIGPDSATTWKLYGEYEVMSGLTVGAQLHDISDLFGAKLYGLSGTYSFGTGAFAQLGAVYQDVSGSSGTLTTAAIGFRF